MSSQQGQTLARKSLSCRHEHLPYIFIHMKWNVTLSMISEHTRLSLKVLTVTFNMLSFSCCTCSCWLSPSQKLKCFSGLFCYEVRLRWFTTSPTVDILSNCCSDPKQRPASLPFPVCCKTNMHMHCTCIHVQKPKRKCITFAHKYLHTYVHEGEKVSTHSHKHTHTHTDGISSWKGRDES